MKIVNKKFKDLFLLKHNTYKDKRGYFKEILRENKINTRFPFIVMSYSKKNVIRGLHLQTKKSQGKFVSVIKGKIFDTKLAHYIINPDTNHSINQLSETYLNYSLIDLQLSQKFLFPFGCKQQLGVIVQFIAFAKTLAIVVLPTPLGPVKRYA